jgi:hypothetical protein
MNAVQQTVIAPTQKGRQLWTQTKGRRIERNARLSMHMSRVSDVQHKYGLGAKYVVHIKAYTYLAQERVYYTFVTFVKNIVC